MCKIVFPCHIISCYIYMYRTTEERYDWSFLFVKHWLKFLHSPYWGYLFTFYSSFIARFFIVSLLCFFYLFVLVGVPCSHQLSVGRIVFLALHVVIMLLFCCGLLFLCIQNFLFFVGWFYRKEPRLQN